MYDIAICDDCGVDRERLKKLIKRSDCRDDIRIHMYDCGEALLDAMEDIRFSAVFLDIQMKEIDGNQTAVEIRKRDNNLILAFYTGYIGPSPHSFEVLPYRYITKDMEEMEMARYVSDCIEKMTALNQVPVLTAKVGRETLILRPEDIIFIEKYKRSTLVHMAKNAQVIYKIKEDDKIRIMDKLENLYNLLKPYGFGYPHDSYIINFKYLIHCTAANLVLAGENKDFMIARSKAAEFNKLKDRFLLLKY